MRLWGDYYYYPSENKFSKKPSPAGSQRTFVHFILEPIYKVYSQILGEHPKRIERTLNEFGVHLKASAYNMDVKPLIKEACSAIFKNASGI